MVVLWGAFWGAVLGWAWPGYGYGDYWIWGAVLGAAAGGSLQRVIKTLVRQQWEEAREKERQTDRAVAAAVHAAVVPATAAPVPASVTPAAPVPAASPPPLPAQPVLVSSSLPVSAQEPSLDLEDTVPAAAQPWPSAHIPGYLTASSGSVPRPRVARAPAPPSALEQALEAARQWFLGGNMVARVGLLVLFLGLTFLARYAAQMGLFPIEFRLASIGAAGVALLAVGFRKRQAKPAFGVLLQGGGVAVLYLTVFAAFRLYQLVPQTAAFVFMVLVCALSCALALLQNARSLAFAAFAGGFAAPLLVSTGAGNHVVLFGYYTLLDVAIVYIASRRAWRELDLLGFAATFGVAAIWVSTHFAPEHYLSAQLFLAIFIAIYLATVVLHARRTTLDVSGWKVPDIIHHVLLFGTPLFGFGLQSQLVAHLPFGRAFSALVLGAVYLLLAAWLLRQRTQEGPQPLAEIFLALGVGFGTLAVPLALDTRWTSAAWVVEGVVLFWVGMRQSRWLARAAGLLLQAVAALVFMPTMQATLAASWPLLHAKFMGAALLAACLVVTAWWARKALPHSGSAQAEVYAAVEAQLPQPLFLAGFGFWILAWSLEAFRMAPGVLADEWRHAWSPVAGQWLLAVAVLASSAAALLWALRTRWPVAAWPSRLGVPVLAALLLAQTNSGHHVVDYPAWWLWPLAWGMHLWLMHRNERAGSALMTEGWQRWMGWQHTASVWLATALVADALYAWIDRAHLWGTAWASVVGVVAATAMLTALTYWAGRANRRRQRVVHARWPLNLHAENYYWRAGLPLAVLVGLGALALACTSSGVTRPLPYVPLLNPTDLAVLLALGAVLYWRAAVVYAQPAPTGSVWLCQREFWMGLGVLGWMVVNTIWLRVAHHFFAVPWDVHALFASFVVQTGYSILWTLMALALMVSAHRRGSRPVWLAGAGLLGLVVAKLMLVDLSNQAGTERIVAFIGVGVLMLVIGYFSPMPPKAQKTQEVQA
ncbi:MAG: DUF2339 domain-containing protein [Brachymonas sp.]|nr:DUF2339 domain-containing protein [Brachymonas sp.]